MLKLKTEYILTKNALCVIMQDFDSIRLRTLKLVVYENFSEKVCLLLFKYADYHDCVFIKLP